MHRLTQIVQGHQRLFLQLKHPDVQTALIQALKELGKKQAGVMSAAASSSSAHHDSVNQAASGDVVQGVQRQIHSGRRYPSFGKASFGQAYEPWSDDMACILQGSCLPGSTRYCRTLSMFKKMELEDVAQGTMPLSNGLSMSGGKRHYHTLARQTSYGLLNSQSIYFSSTGLVPEANPTFSCSYATDSQPTEKDKASPLEGDKTASQEPESGQVSQRQRLKMAVRDYGSTVIVFHVCISLMSLGGFYLAVSSGIDVQSLLSFLGFSKEVIESKFATGTSTFVMAYAVHKVFAPVRIAITLTCTPFIVRYLRGVGLLKRARPSK